MRIFKFFAIENMFMNCITLFDNKSGHLVLEYLDYSALVEKLDVNKNFKCLIKEEYHIIRNLSYMISN